MKRISTFVALLAVVIVFTFAALPAYACACGDPASPEGAMQFAEYFNSQPYEVRSTANVLPPAQYGWAMSTDYYMVGMNLCGQTVECF